MSAVKVSANIMGQMYDLTAPEEEAAVLRAAIAKVDESMCKIRDAGKIKARDRIAVLAALNIALDLLQSGQNKAGGADAEKQLNGVDYSQRIAQLTHRMDAILTADGKLF